LLAEVLQLCDRLLIENVREVIYVSGRVQLRDWFGRRHQSSKTSKNTMPDFAHKFMVARSYRRRIAAQVTLDLARLPVTYTYLSTQPKKQAERPYLEGPNGLVGSR
jgi:hypothetical protein